jgi:hypothetical protein
LLLLLAGATTGDESESPTQAVELGELEQVETVLVRGAIDYQGDDDWFSFRLPGSARLVIYPQWAQEIELRFVVYDAGLSLVAEGGEWAALSLEPGAYLVKVDSPRGTGAYQFYVSTALETEPNDEARRGLFLGTLTPETPLKGSGTIEPGEDVDYFVFEIEPGACPDAVLRIASPRFRDEFVEMTLYQLSPTGRPRGVVAESSLSGSRLQSVLRGPVAPGRYGIKVEADESREIPLYNLTVWCFVPCRDPEPNDEVKEAVELGTLPGDALQACGYIAGDDRDFYHFSLSGAAEVVISTGGEDDGDSYLELVDARGHPIATDDNSGGGGWSRISVALEPGDYYVIVSKYAFAEGEFEYQLTLEATPQLTCIPEQEPNDEFTSPMRLGALPVCIRPATLPPDREDVDLFQFRLFSPSRVVVEVIGDGHFWLYIADANQPWNIFAEVEGSGSQSLEVDLEAGLYFLHVGGFIPGESSEYMVRIETR